MTSFQRRIICSTEDFLNKSKTVEQDYRADADISVHVFLLPRNTQIKFTFERDFVKDSELENIEMFESIEKAVYSLAKNFDEDPGNRVDLYSLQVYLKSF